jgi:uncharacterized protein (DUF433 family)
MQPLQTSGMYSVNDKRDTELVSRTDPRSGVVSIDPERHSGTPCFVGTRVPVQDLWDYLAGGESLDSFLDSFPSVSREMAIKVIELAAERLMEGLPTR